MPRRLVKNHYTGKLKATWWAQRPGGNWYWRCEVPSRALPGQVLALRYDDLQPSKQGVLMPRQKSDAAIWCYVGNATRGILMGAQIEAGYKVLVEVDDNYLISSPQVPQGHTDWQFKASLASEGDKHSIQAHRRLVKYAHGVIATTEELAKAYREYNDHVFVCPNSLDPDDWLEPEKPNDGIFRIGYAASHSHWFDANDVYRALSWAAEQPDVEVLVYGLDPKWPFPHTQVPWTKDLAEYRKSLQLLDVGVCPLRPNPWSNCKSDIKALEYCMSGAAPIVSDTIPYQGWTNGMALTAATPKEFLKRVQWLVRNRDAATELAANARTYALAERTIDRFIHRWHEAIA